MSRSCILLMVQVDDAPGELLGEVLHRLSTIGVKNSQLLSSVGKKGRPGYVLMIDCFADQEKEVAGLLAGELGVWGYRVLHSDHKHLEVERYGASLEIDTGSAIKTFPVGITRILHDGNLLRVKAEHDDLSAICAALGAEGVRVRLAALKAQVESAVRSTGPGETARITLE
jgi:uncharacterized protein (DUF111 family)